MRIVDALRDRSRLAEVLDPSSPRLVAGSPDEQKEARLLWHRHRFISRVVNSDRVEIPRLELVFLKRGIIEHEPTGDWYRAIGGDPEFLPNAEWYFVTEGGDPVMLERASPSGRAEFEQLRAERDERRAERDAARTEHWKNLKADVAR